MSPIRSFFSARAAHPGVPAEGYMDSAVDKLEDSVGANGGWVSRRAVLIIWTAFTLLYLATRTSDYYWDGITFALQIEKVADSGRTTQLLFHQNHLIYNAVGYLLYRFTHAIGFSTRSLYILQTANAFVGAGAISVFFVVAYRTTRNYYVAIVCALALAVSAAWWKISTDANAYVPALFFMLLCFNNLIGRRPRWFVAGAALAAAMLTHQLAALFYPAALVAIRTSGVITRKRRFAVSMSTFAWAVTVAVYYCCAAIEFGIYRPLEVLGWAISNPSHKKLSTNPVEGIRSFLRSNFDAFIGHDFALLKSHGGTLTIILVVIATLLAAVALFKAAPKVRAALRTLRERQAEITSRPRQIIPVLLTWVVVYAVFLIFWGPLIYFRAFYMPAILLGVGLMLSQYYVTAKQRPGGASLFAVLALALLNFGLYIQINMDPASNSLVSAARRAAGTWESRTIIICSKENEADTAFEYFTPGVEWRHRTSKAVREFSSSGQLTEAESGSIWLNKGAAQAVDPDWLKIHRRGESIEVTSSHGVARYVQLRSE